MDSLITSLERQLATFLTDTTLPQPTSNSRTSSRSGLAITSRDLILAIREYQQNIEQYQQNMDMLIRLLNRTMQTESNQPLPRTGNTRIFTMFSEPTETEPHLTQAQINTETSTVLYDASSAQHHVCPITLEDFVSGEVVTKINGCEHIFKTDYLMRWLERKNYCPVCRYNLLDHAHTNVGTRNPPTPNPVMTDEYEVVPPTTTPDEPTETAVLADDDDAHFTFEIPLFYDVSNNQLLNPESGEHATSHQMQSYIMQELMRGFTSGIRRQR